MHSGSIRKYVGAPKLGLVLAGGTKNEIISNIGGNDGINVRIMKRWE